MARNVDLVEERALAEAVFERARSDLRGGYVMTRSLRHERNAKRNALVWAHEAGDNFRFWCDVAGLEVSRARRELMEIVPRDERRELLQAHATEQHRQRRREQQDELRRRCAAAMRRRRERLRNGRIARSSGGA